MGSASSGTHVGAQRDLVEPRDGRADQDDRVDSVLTLSRLATKRGAVRAILDWLGRRTGGIATLLDTDGASVVVPPPAPSATLRAAADAVVTLHRRGTPSAILDRPGSAPPHSNDLSSPTPGSAEPSRGTGGSTVFLVALTAGAGGGHKEPRPGRRQPPYLVLIAPDSPGSPDGPDSGLDGPTGRSKRHHVLLADTARTLSLCWRLEEAERDRLRVETAEAHSREAVLHLLMVGSVPAAHRIAAALQPPLPQLAYVYVIECPGQRRYEIADRITRAARGKAWIVPCPVRPTHLIALVPATTATADTALNCASDFRAPHGELPGAARTFGRAEQRPGASLEMMDDDATGVRGLDRKISERVPECLIGVSSEVPLRETPIGYGQAFHALAVARTAPSGRASFQRDSDLSPLAVPQGFRWAQDLLAPCVHYAPPRRADPGGDELLGTLSSWLTFGSAASRHLKIHRNTLAARVRLIDELLGLDLGRLADQSAAWLALQLNSPRVPVSATEPPATLDALLATPATEVWARARLQPLERANLPSGTATVRAWLRADAKLPLAAAQLGISLPGARKRLTRAEEVLGRSLLHAPSAKHELWLAMRALGTL
ncbi:PucR family transcriptional regulator [Streptomyces zagrosensis]|uniref:PucR C-terminal helix-turn-helix domain-containing protein n=1 Tax=Streptomyces zagrosensis TaxID=1042984 RepID=A0A7W9QEJ8_9ACTN|nr:helix-turn-helix domain-containing protein [Streptomyces zagrosensis]MBB5938263.1 hypothetical protein [Streptomyces zagrosensis]